MLQMVGGRSGEKERGDLGKELLHPATLIYCNLTSWIFSPAQPSITPHVTVTSFIVISNCQPQRFASGSEKVPEALCQFKINPVITGHIVLLQK